MVVRNEGYGREELEELQLSLLMCTNSQKLLLRMIPSFLITLSNYNFLKVHLKETNKRNQKLARVKYIIVANNISRLWQILVKNLLHIKDCARHLCCRKRLRPINRDVRPELKHIVTLDQGFSSMADLLLGSWDLVFTNIQWISIYFKISLWITNGTPNFTFLKAVLVITASNITLPTPLQ